GGVIEILHRDVVCVSLNNCSQHRIVSFLNKPPKSRDDSRLGRPGGPRHTSVMRLARRWSDDTPEPAIVCIAAGGRASHHDKATAAVLSLPPLHPRPPSCGRRAQSV